MTVAIIETGALTGVTGIVTGYFGRGDYLIAVLPGTAPHYVPRWLRVAGSALYIESGEPLGYAPVLGPSDLSGLTIEEA